MVESFSGLEASSSLKLFDQVSKLCQRTPLQICRLLYDAEDLPTDCTSEPLDLVVFQLNRPVILGLCILGCIVSLDLSLAAFDEHYNSARGRIEYCGAFFIFALLNVFTILDHCFFTDDSTISNIWIFLDVVCGVWLAISLVLGGLADQARGGTCCFFKTSIRKIVQNWITFSLLTIQIYFLALGCSAVALFITMVAKAYVALEIIWFGAIIGVIIAYPILQTFLTARRREIQAATLLVVSLAIFVAGFIAWMFFGNWLCENLTKYTGGEEAFWLGAIISMWIFYRFYAQVKKDELDHNTIGKIMTSDGEMVTVVNSSEGNVTTGDLTDRNVGETLVFTKQDPGDSVLFSPSPSHTIEMRNFSTPATPSKFVEV